MTFASLHVHDQYSLLDSVAKTEELIFKAKELNLAGLAITNHGNLFSHVKFYYLCREMGVHPIIGVEAYVSENYLIRDPKMPRYHLTLLAMNETGYRNLLKLVSLSYVKGFYYFPRMDWTLLKTYGEGLICLSGCLLSEFSHAILEKKQTECEAWINRAKEIFPDRLYLEFTPANHPDTAPYLDGLMQVKKKTKLPLVLTSDVHYLTPEDVELREMVWAIQDKKTVQDSKRHETVKEYYLMGEEEARTKAKRFKVSAKLLDEMIQNTGVIAERCQVQLHPDQYVIAKYSETSQETFQELVEQAYWEKVPGMIQNLGEEKIYRERMEYECQVVKTMGLENYFLVVQDVLNFCRQEKIIVGPGRGSAAGSLICFLLGITKVDPIKYSLLFERFLNPGRAESYPDIDTDIAHQDRERVIDYLKQKYGQDRVSNIVTFGSMGPKAAIKDVSRALGYSFLDMNPITKLIPNKVEGSPTQSLQQAINQIEELQEYQKKYPEVFRLALKIEDTPRHVSMHASAFLVTPTPVNEIAPLYRNPDSEDLVCGIDMYDCEKLKLLKFDFLGLKTLSVEEEAIQLIQERYQKEIRLDDLTFDDPKVWDLFCSAETVGTFQTETEAMRVLLRKIQPRTIQELSVVNAMDRPGPLNKKMDEMYAKRKRGEEAAVVIHESIKHILAPTYQTLVYQEQVMQIAEVFAGFSKSEADVLRKSMGKKKRDLVLKMKELFVQGAAKLGRPPEVTEKLFSIIEEFSEYAFNMSHSLAYSITSYHTAWLKVYYPLEFMCALLNVFKYNQEEVQKYLEECQRMGISIVAPDINLSQNDFIIREAELIYGFTAIRNVGTDATKSILDHRPFLSIDEFFMKVRGVSSRTIEALIYAGAFDQLFPYRKALLKYSEEEKESRKKNRAKEDRFTGHLFDFSQIFAQTSQHAAMEKEEFSLGEKLTKEKEFLGYYRSGHPLDILPYEHQSKADQIQTLTKQIDMIQNRFVNIHGIIEEVTMRTTKKDNRQMAFMKISDRSGNIKVVIFPKKFEELKDKLIIGRIVSVGGRISLDQIAANEISLLTSQ